MTAAAPPRLVCAAAARASHTGKLRLPLTHRAAGLPQSLATPSCARADNRSAAPGPSATPLDLRPATQSRPPSASRLDAMPIASGSAGGSVQHVF